MMADRGFAAGEIAFGSFAARGWAVGALAAQSLAVVTLTLIFVTLCVKHCCRSTPAPKPVKFTILTLSSGAKVSVRHG